MGGTGKGLQPNASWGATWTKVLHDSASIPRAKAVGQLIFLTNKELRSEIAKSNHSVTKSLIGFSSLQMDLILTAQTHLDASETKVLILTTNGFDSDAC